MLITGFEVLKHIEKMAGICSSSVIRSNTGFPTARDGYANPQIPLEGGDSKFPVTEVITPKLTDTARSPPTDIISVTMDPVGFPPPPKLVEKEHTLEFPWKF
jgi:hypothetical protein